MIGKRYSANKENMIDLFEAYKRKRGNINDGVDIKFLEKKINNLKNKKFLLAVAGEVKAGKSTFINALLGEELLPSDVLQATSAIVQIFKSETSYLKVKFADGHEETLYDDLSTPDVDEAKEKLQELCRIDDNYRDIPTTLIDQFIIESDGQLVIDKNFIKELEQKSETHLDGKETLIRDYIAKRKKDKIPVEIEFGYPLKWSFDELRIVDTPGVNATGGVQDVSFRFFEEANAILFVHPIEPVEAESFRKFVNSVVSNRSKEMLFLVLTHAGLYPNDDVEKLYEEAKRLYKDIIPEERILVVDSLLKLIYDELKKGIPLSEIRKSSQKKKILSSYREQAEDEGRELIDVVLEASGFEKMIKAIDEFSMKAPSLQLKEIVEQIKRGYEEQEKQYLDRIKLLNTKRRNPQEFENEINYISKALGKYQLFKNQAIEDFRAKYSGRHSQWQKGIDSLKSQYSGRITESTDEEGVRKNFVDAMNAIQDKVNEFSRELRQELEEKFQKIGRSFKEEYHISIPRVDLKSLEEKAKKNAYRDEPVYETRIKRLWYFLWLKKEVYKVPVGSKKVFDEGKFLDALKTKCAQEFSRTVSNVGNKLKEVRENYLGLFSKEVDSVIEEREKNLAEMKEKKQSNKEIIGEIKELERKKKEIQSEKLIRCKELLGDLE